MPCRVSSGNEGIKLSQFTLFLMHSKYGSYSALAELVSSVRLYSFHISLSSPLISSMSNGPTHQNACCSIFSERRSEWIRFGLSPQTHLYTNSLFLDGSKQCFQSTVCKKSINVDTTPIIQVNAASYPICIFCRSNPSTVPVVWATSWSTIEPTPLLWSSMPMSRKRCAIDCDAHTATACSLTGSSWRLPICTVLSFTADSIFWISLITSFKPQDTVFSIPIAM